MARLSEKFVWILIFPLYLYPEIWRTCYWPRSLGPHCKLLYLIFSIQINGTPANYGKRVSHLGHKSELEKRGPWLSLGS